MKYLVFGAGGTGGSLAAFLAQGGKDVSLIARGAHLEAIRRNGLVLESRHGTFAIPVEAEDAEHCSCRPDVILLCVKGYSLAETVPALKRLCDAHTIVIPILNLYGTAPAGAGPRPGDRWVHLYRRGDQGSRDHPHEWGYFPGGVWTPDAGGVPLRPCAGG